MMVSSRCSLHLFMIFCSYVIWLDLLFKSVNITLLYVIMPLHYYIITLLEIYNVYMIILHVHVIYYAMMLL